MAPTVKALQNQLISYEHGFTLLNMTTQDSGGLETAGQW